MAKWTDYAEKEGLADNDEIIILDKETNTNKRSIVSNIVNGAVEKIGSHKFSGLNTDDKTLVGAINEVDAKNDAQDKKIEEVENKFSDYLKKTDVDSTLSVSGSPADAKVVGEQFRKSEEAITDLADKKITKFYASNQGNTHLPDSGKGKIQDMFLYGKSEQVQYKGKNLWDNFKILSKGNVEQKNGTYIATTNTMQVDVELDSTGARPLLLKANNTYTFSFKTTVSISKRKYVCLKYTNGETNNIPFWNKNNVNFVPEKDVEKIGFVLYNSVVGDKAYDFQLENGSEVTPYEPYTGGIPSPNPDYPQEIKAVVNPKVIVMGKNLLKVTAQTKTINGVTFTVNEDGTVKVNGTATALTSFSLTSGSVENTFVGKKVVGCPSGGSTESYTLAIAYYNSDKQLQTEEFETYSNSIIIKDYVRMSPNIRIQSGATVNNLIFKPMLTADTTATYDDYEPYTEQSATFPYTLYAIPVTKEGNITIGRQQYAADYVDVERGKLVRMCKKNIIKISHNMWFSMGNGYYNNVNVYNIRTMIEYQNIFSNIFAQADGKSMWNRMGIGTGYKAQILSGLSSIRFYVETSLLPITDISTTVVYPLATPEEIDLTPEQIQAFKSLATNYPVTNIEVSSDQLDGYTVFNYPISMAEGWNYVKQQIGDTRDYIYDMDLQSAEAYVNSEYAVALTELEV